MKLHNSLTRRKEALPVAPAALTMYSCGVTVYDRCHIGHARSLYTFETLVRWLRARGYAVRFVRNITDVDDKIIARAADTGKTFEQVVTENIAAYYEDMKALGIPPADAEPRATENIPLMVRHIEGLITRGYAYAAGEDVYFRVRAFPEYGKLSGQSVDKMREAVRIDRDENKEDPLDFALWKAARPGEPSWPSPWGAGRPGWHIECSCMSMKHLGTETLDIHAGGRDLIFPHHENEIAQSEALTGKPFASFWVHHGLLTINAQKMAKSLGNFITVRDALTRHSVAAFKLFFLSTHYASSIDYTVEKLEDMEKNAGRLRALYARLAAAAAVQADALPEPPDFLREQRERITAALDDDLNTALALGHGWDLVSAANRYLDSTAAETAAGPARAVLMYLKELFIDVFGLELSSAPRTEALPPDAEALLAVRAAARRDRDWKRSDELRDRLKAMGILVEDGKQGQTWRISGTHT